MRPPPRPVRPRERRSRYTVVLTAVMLSVLIVGCGGEAPLPGEPLRITTRTLPDPVQGEAYRVAIVASGGLRPYELRLDAGELPPGLVLQGGSITGTPQRLGRYEFTIAVSDGNLSSTFERFVLTVRTVPVPQLTIEVPATEAREQSVLPVRVSNARSFRAARIRLTWTDPSLTLADPAVLDARNDLALFWEAREDGIAIDVAFLGAPLDGEAELFRLAFEISAATRIGIDAEVELLYADRHSFEQRRVGAPKMAPEPAEGDGQ